MNIRNIELSDLDQLVIIEKSAFSVGPYTRNMLKRMILTERSFGFVAVEGDRIAGYVAAIPLDGSSADVESIAVHPDFQGKGVGGLLLDAAEEEMKKRGYVRSILEVRDMNFESIGFYKKHGYEEVRHMKSYYHEYYRGSRGAFRMSKDLKNAALRP